MAERSFLTCRWESLLILSYEVDADAVRPHLPPFVELDAYNDRHYLSLVGLRFESTKLFGLPIPGHTSFDDINFRTYARSNVAGAPAKGIVFIKELVPKPAVAWLARMAYNEPFDTAPITSRRPHRADGGALVEYEVGYGGKSHKLSGRLGKCLGHPKAGSFDDFLVNRPWGFTKLPDGGASRYRVEHPAWKVWKMAEAEFDGDPEALYGVAFARFIARDPAYALFAEGSPVRVMSRTPHADD